MSHVHEFVGRLDRWCEVCKRPDRHPIHDTLRVLAQRRKIREGSLMAHRYDNVSVSVRSTADESSVAFGVVIGDAFLPFHWMPTGGFEDDLATVAQDVGQFAGPQPPAEPQP